MYDEQNQSSIPEQIRQKIAAALRNACTETGSFQVKFITPKLLTPMGINWRFFATPGEKLGEWLDRNYPEFERSEDGSIIFLRETSTQGIVGRRMSNEVRVKIADILNAALEKESSVLLSDLGIMLQNAGIDRRNYTSEGLASWMTSMFPELSKSSDGLRLCRGNADHQGPVTVASSLPYPPANQYLSRIDLDEDIRQMHSLALMGWWSNNVRTLKELTGCTGNDMLNDHKLQMIVATNFDFNATSLPRGMTNSTLLSRLSPNTVHMTPLSRESCETLLRKTAMDCGCGFCFSEEQSRFIYELSGGIPLLLNLTARYVFEAISNGAEENWKEIARRNALQDAGPILKRWCKIMTSEQLQLLEDLPKKGDGLSEDEVILATALQKRGILGKGSQCNSGEIWKSTDAYCYNSGLLDEFCRDPEWMNEAARCNPLKKEESDLLSFDPSALIGGNQGTVHIEKIEIHNGDRYETTYQPTVMTGGFDKLFEILALNPSQMGGRLRDMFTTSLPTIVDADQAAEHISTLFIPEAVESGTLEEFQEEQKTLEIKFQAVRSKVLPNLDDDLMDLLSVKCRLYLQIAVVVEDALSVLDDFKLGDLSAQMVMYGKVLEQQLRDNLYPLFHKEDGLKHFDTYAKQNNPYSDKTFASMSVKKTCIGNYVYLMQDCSSHLKDLCSSNEVYYNTGVITSQWWSQLGSDVNDARDLRNRTDHAGSETNKANLESMHDLLFGNGQIMRRCVVGSDLTRKLWPEAETASAGSSSCIPVVEENVDSWIGKIVTVTNIEATKRGSLRGSFEGSHYAVSISPKKLLECGCRAEDFLGQCINARIIRWDKNAQAFNGELV